MAVLVAKGVTKRFGGLDALSKIDLEVKEILFEPHFRFWRYGSLMALVNAK